MNLYIVVEGRSAERKLYPSWISFVNPHLTQIFDIADYAHNNYFLISGMGYPQYFEIIDAAIEDVNANADISHLVICVDSENMSFDEKKAEIIAHINGRIQEQKLKIVIQHFCLETWALGNQVIHKRNPTDSDLRAYIRFFNACLEDPELMPDAPQFSMNRSQFSYEYLRRSLREKYPHLSYSKKSPMVLAHPKYYERVKQRHIDKQHIKSFASFLNAFS